MNIILNFNIIIYQSSVSYDNFFFLSSSFILSLSSSYISLCCLLVLIWNLVVTYWEDKLYVK